MFNPYYLLRPSVVLRILLTVTDRIKSLLSRVFLPCLFISLQEVILYSLLVVGYKSQVDLLLFLLVAFDVTYGCKDSVGIFFRSLGFGFRPTSAFASATALVVTQGYCIRLCHCHSLCCFLVSFCISASLRLLFKSLPFHVKSPRCLFK